MQELQQGTVIDEALKGLVEDGQLGLAQRWADTLPQACQIVLVNHCVSVDRLKEAVKLVRHLKLQEVSHDIAHSAYSVSQLLFAQAHDFW